MCIFCDIAAGKIPSTCVYSDEHVYAFRDINPQAPVHILVIPREHIGSAGLVTPDNSQAVARCFEVIGKIAEAEGLKSGYRIISNVGPDAGQTVEHLHFHIIGGLEMSEQMV